MSNGSQQEALFTSQGFHAGALMILGFGHLVTDLSQGGLPVLLPFIRETFGLSYAAAGAVLMTSNLTSSIIQPIFGYFSDRWGSSWLLPVGVFTASLGFASLGFAPGFWALLGAVFVSGLGVASYHPEGFKAARFFTGQKKATGISIFAVGGNVGIALGPLLAVWGHGWLGLKGTVIFLIPGFMAVFILLLSLRFLSRPQKELFRSSYARSTKGPRPLGRRWIPVLMLICAVTIRSLIHMGIVAFVPFYLVDVLKAGGVAAGKMVTVFLMAGAAGTLIGAPIADRVGHKRFFVASMLILIPVLWAFLAAEGLAAFALLAMAGAVLVSSFSVTIVMAQQVLPDRLGMASGLMVGFAIGTGGIAATVMGSVADAWGVLRVLQITAALPALGALLAMTIPYPYKWEEHREAEPKAM
ncbi:MAG: MFS transporter [Thermodesulfobacteriota bacterium]